MDRLGSVVTVLSYLRLGHVKPFKRPFLKPTCIRLWDRDREL